MILKTSLPRMEEIIVIFNVIGWKEMSVPSDPIISQKYEKDILRSIKNFALQMQAGLQCSGYNIITVVF